MRHAGAVAIVTGASRGIGLGIAQRLVAEGARVVITGRKADALAAAVDTLGGPDHALGMPGNTSDPVHIAQTVAAAGQTFGGLDLLVNNTGINPQFGPMLDADVDVVRKIFDTNVVAAAQWIKAAMGAGLRESDRAAVVNVASIAGFNATGMIGWYAVSKAAVMHLTRELAYQLGPAVRVNAVAPAVVKTKFAEALYAGHEEQVASAYPLKRLGTPQDIAGAVSFLLSADAGWITGETLVVDGGVTLGGAL
jgi:NAD(P)-dependent dehydrogenase (short-subunit alcohol dehydrogenase family)